MENSKVAKSGVVSSLVSSSTNSSSDEIKDNNPNGNATDSSNSTFAKELLQIKSVLAGLNSMKDGWHEDPLHSPDWDAAGPPGCLSAGRVKRDIASIYHDPLPGIFAVPADDNLFKVHCLIIGPFDTPYEGGFFNFVVRFGPEYPLHPPRVRLLTTGGGTVRFNPNLYGSGKVCLSILGTWRGPAWSPASNLATVLLSLQSLLNEKPYHNEPGYETERHVGDSDRYNLIIQHETIRVSVCNQLYTRSSLPEELYLAMRESFLDFYDHYVYVCQKNVHLDGLPMNDPFKAPLGKFCYKSILTHLNKLKIEISEELLKSSSSSMEDNDGASSVSESEELPTTTTTAATTTTTTSSTSTSTATTTTKSSSSLQPLPTAPTPKVNKSVDDKNDD